MYSKLRRLENSIYHLKDIHLRKLNYDACFLSDEQIQRQSISIEYRAQLALYELHKEIAEDNMSWEEYVSQLRTDRKIRNKIQSVIEFTANRFCLSCSDFENIDEEFHEETDAVTEIAEIFSFQGRKYFIDMMTIMPQVAYFLILSRDRFQEYSLKDCKKDLQNNQMIWNNFYQGFQQGLQQINFKHRWKMLASKEEIRQLKFKRQPIFKRRYDDLFTLFCKF